MSFLLWSVGPGLHRSSQEKPEDGCSGPLETISDFPGDISQLVKNGGNTDVVTLPSPVCMACLFCQTKEELEPFHLTFDR